MLLIGTASQARGQKLKIRILFDSASNVSLLKKDVAKELGLIGQQIELEFSASGGGNHKYIEQQECWFKLMSLDKKFTTPVIQAGTLPKVTSDFKPLVLDVKKYDHLAEIGDLTEDYSKKKRGFEEVDLLLGIPHQCHYSY